ncbi:hypothetical protein IX332_000268 [Porphyromonas levii]|uniref:DDE-type integrase/transposase/recombinase n=1 Tax=Porphyromonas levii TaxID=28114 RepID=UPI001B8B43F7|nr:hypothetical protein [Porphyromonas levii]MBR8763135.1 hypothetical protein [Porphyromonas levii]
MPSYVQPYLLRGLKIERPNHAWSTDISYIPMEKGFMYLYAVIDVYSRFVVGWKLSNTLSANNCTKLKEKRIRISMDGKGRCKDNIWIERFWRSIKQEHIYLNPVDIVSELRQGIGKWIKFYK